MDCVGTQNWLTTGYKSRLSVPTSLNRGHIIGSFSYASSGSRIFTSYISLSNETVNHSLLLANVLGGPYRLFVVFIHLLLFVEKLGLSRIMSYYHVIGSSFAVH